MKTKLFILLCGVIVFAACSSGGSGKSNSGPSNGASSSSSGNSGGSSGGPYQVNLSSNSVDLFINYDLNESNSTISLNVEYKGDGLILGFPAGGDEDQNITAEIIGQTATKAIIRLTYAGNTRFNMPGTYPIVMRVVTGSENGTGYAYKDFTVNRIQRDGISIDTVFLGTDGGKIKFDTGNLSWTITSDQSWMQFDSTSGSGSTEINYSYDYSLMPPGSNTANVTIAGQDGNANDEKIVTINVENGIQISHSHLAGFIIQGLWGSPAEDTIDIVTKLQNWTLSSDIPGLTFNPSSGSGTTQVVVGYDPARITDLLQIGKITATASGQIADVDSTLSLFAPNLAAPLINNHAELELNKTIAMLEPSVEWSLALENGANVDWEISDLPSFLEVSSTEGSNQDSIVFRVNQSLTTSSNYHDSFTVTLKIPSSPLVINVDATVTVETFRIQLDDYSLGFSSYPGAPPLVGTVDFNPATRLHGLVIAATPDQNWITDLVVTADGLMFDIDDTQLSTGFHTAEIALSTGNPLVQATRVNVGVYKTDQAPTNLSSVVLPSPDFEVVAVNPLGPWMYLKSESSGQIEVFNSLTGVLETPIAINQDEPIYKGVITGNGKNLILSRVDSLLIYDLETKQLVDTIPDFSTSAVPLKQFHLGGHTLLSGDDRWLDLESFTTYNAVNVPSNYASYLAAPSGKGLVVTDTDGAAQCGAYNVIVDVNPSQSLLSFGAAAPIHGFCDRPYELTVASETGNLLMFHDNETNQVELYLLDDFLDLRFQRDLILFDIAVSDAAITDGQHKALLLRDTNSGNYFVRVFDASWENSVDYTTSDVDNNIYALGIQLSSDGGKVVYLERNDSSGETIVLARSVN